MRGVVHPKASNESTFCLETISSYLFSALLPIFFTRNWSYEHYLDVSDRFT